MKAIIGPAGWGRQIGFQSEFGPYIAPDTSGFPYTIGSQGFVDGYGTVGPSPYSLASIPLAQAFRYYWAIRYYQIAWNVTLTQTFPPAHSGIAPPPIVTNSTFDTGKTLLPLLAEGLSTTVASRMKYGPGFSEGAFDADFNSVDVGLYQSLGGGAGAEFPVDFPMVYDDSQPGNVFMAFGCLLTFFDAVQGVGTGQNAGDPYEPIAPATLYRDSGITASLDGMPFRLFNALDGQIGGTGSTYAGSIVVTTFDS